MKLTIIGSSDAFGSGGRLQTCFHVAHDRGEFLIDCGATSLTGLWRQGIDPNRISTIFISHLHGDHFAGLVWWLIHANHVSDRTAPLTIVGPEGIEARFTTVAEALFPGSTATPRRFDLTFLAHAERTERLIDGVSVTPFQVSHPSGAPPYALRFAVDGKILAFSGDTEWVDALLPAARGADLFICECTGFAKSTAFHLNWRELEPRIDAFGAKRVLLTHLGPDTLANAATIRHPLVMVSQDGLQLEI
jgi:ribonuclease BN (tRNA processing enzyme)